MDRLDDPVIARQRQLGRALAEWRKLSGFNQTELARRLAYDRTTVAHAERGAQIPAEEFWRACDERLAASGALLRLYEALQEAKQRKAEEAAAGARAERRARLAGLMAEDPGAVADNSQRTVRTSGTGLADAVPIGGDVVRAGVAIDPQLPETLRALLVQYAKTDNMVGPRSLLPVVSAQVGLISKFTAVASGVVRRELVGVGAWYAEFAGWLSQDAGDLRSAAIWSDRALEWAHVDGAPLMVSYVLMRKSSQASSAGDTAGALGLAEAALREPGLTPRVRALALRQKARGHALEGDSMACERALEAARTDVASDEDHGDDDRALSGYCTPAYVEMEAGDCWMALGAPTKAIATFEQGLAIWPPGYERDRGLHLARLAVAYATANEPEQACGYAEQAAVLARETGSTRTLQELGRLHARLSAWGDDLPAVRSLRDVLATLRERH